MYSRKDTKEAKSDATYSYSDAYGWYTSLGKTAEQAFETVREVVVRLATLAAQGDMEAIDAYQQPLWETVTWKIAFHYQDRQHPKVVDVFKKSMLAVHLGDSEKLGMGALQKATLAQMPADMGILEYGHRVWESWSKKNLAIWKLSHGGADFTDAERQQYKNENLAVMHKDTGKKQGKYFIDAKISALFFRLFRVFRG